MKRLLLNGMLWAAFSCLASGQRIQVLHPGDTLFFPKNADTAWLLRPVYGDFSQMDSLMALCYRRDRPLADGFWPAAGPGTYFFHIGRPERDTFCSIGPVCETFPVWQVTVRRDSSFIGFCEELLGLPFVLPPRRIPGFGHQTDLRLATDCAELAIYARRRQGHRLPYVGPKGLRAYLKPADKLEPGAVLHFGFQVSVLYEDRGQPGILDEADLLIHAQREKVEIVPLGETGLLDRRCKIMQWK